MNVMSKSSSSSLANGEGSGGVNNNNINNNNVAPPKFSLYPEARASPTPPVDPSYTPKTLKVADEDLKMRNLTSAADLMNVAMLPSPGLISPVCKPIDVQEGKVLVIYTGGTIGMKTKDGVYSPEPGFLPASVRATPQFNDNDYIEKHYADTKFRPMCLPPVKNCDKRIVYWIVEYDPLLDSSDMTFDDWIRIAKDIYKWYQQYDAFVVLHGTDTLAYTSSALSFMLENLGKPVVITGSQIPVVEVRSDGRENLIGALIVAGGYDIPEVTVYFNNHVYRGNRVSKLDNSGLNAFDSPNMLPLARMEISVKVNHDAIFRPQTIEKCHVHTNLNRRVGLLRIFPSIFIEAVRAFLAPPMEGVIIQTFGAGNMPARRLDIIAAIKEAIDRGVLVVNCSQCVKGEVDLHYATGKALYDIGVIGGADMTPEAALTKLSYVLGHDDWSLEHKYKMMRKNIRGELTTSLRRGTRSGAGPNTNPMLDILPRLVKFFRVGTSTEVELLKQTLFPPLVCSASGAGDTNLLEALRECGAQLSVGDYDHRTALHVAAQAGDVKTVEYLLQNGANLHARDRWDQTPLQSAIHGRHISVINLLREAGAHITAKPTSVGMELCFLACINDDKGIDTWLAAGADAASRGHLRMAEHLLNHQADKYRRDNFGNTALVEARQLGHMDVVKLLTGDHDDNEP